LNPVFLYFPDLSVNQIAQVSQLDELYRSWNERINVISRKDIDNLYLHHVLHSLSIARFLPMKPGTKVLDMGTGGGFPGIPLAILFPEVSFTLVDSIAKKIKVVQAISDSLGLKNITARWSRVEDLRTTFDFVVSRAVTTFPEFVAQVHKRIAPDGFNEIPNGMIYLKGGDIDEEISRYKEKARVQPISAYFSDEFFQTKKIIYLPVG